MAERLSRLPDRDVAVASEDAKNFAQNIAYERRRSGENWDSLRISMRLMQWPNACTGSFAAGWTALILLNVCFLTSNSACSVTVVGRIETLGTEKPRACPA